MRVLVPIADGTEEIELAAISDTLVRCGCDVTTAAVTKDHRQNTYVTCARGLRVVHDTHIDHVHVNDYDAIAIPGGMPGAKHLADSATLANMLRALADNPKKLIGAVCASPAVVLHKHGILPARFTCYPAPAFTDAVGDGWIDAKVVVDGNIVTSQGPGTSLQLALKMGEILCGVSKAHEVAKALLTEMP